MTVQTGKKKVTETARKTTSIAGAMLQMPQSTAKTARTGAAISVRAREGRFVAFKESVTQAGSVERINRIRVGIEAAHIVDVSDYFDLPREEIGNIIGISTSTMNRKLKNRTTLSPAESERLERIAEIEAEAEDVFGDAEMAKKWLLKSNFALGSTPLSMLDTDIGTGEVRKVLSSIAYGGVV